MVAVAEREFGTLDIVVNNAGLTRDSMIHRMNDEDVGPRPRRRAEGDVPRLPLGRAAAPPQGRGAQPEGRQHLVDQRHLRRRIQRELLGREGAGSIGLTKSLAREWAPLRINVNAVAPGFVETRLTAARQEGDEFGHPAGGARADHCARSRSGASGSPTTSRGSSRGSRAPDSDYVTGQVVEIHGGLEIVKVG